VTEERHSRTRRPLARPQGCALRSDRKSLTQQRAYPVDPRGRSGWFGLAQVELGDLVLTEDDVIAAVVGGRAERDGLAPRRLCRRARCGWQR